MISPETFTKAVEIGAVTDVEAIPIDANAVYGDDALFMTVMDIDTGEVATGVVIGYMVNPPMPNCRVYHREFWRNCHCDAHAAIPSINVCLN